MDSKVPPLALEDGLDLRQIITTGSLLQINEHYDEDYPEYDVNLQCESIRNHLGGPVKSLDVLSEEMKNVDSYGFVRKKVLEEGGGKEINEGYTVYVAFSGYWEGDEEPFDARKIEKPLVVDLRENNLLPGLQTAIKSMLVGELSVFLLSYEVMYGEMGIPPRIKPKSDCVFYIKLIKSIITPADRNFNSSESNTFQKIHHEVKMLYCSGVALYKVMNFSGATQLFRKGIYMLHTCRLANESEQCIQEKLLKKLYINLAISYNKMKLPLKACVACNELNRLGGLWNNGKALFQNAKALRMIGEFDDAEKRLKTAMKLCEKGKIEERKEMVAEYELLQTSRNFCNENKLKCVGAEIELVSDEFKREVDNLLMSFKNNTDLCKLTLPGKLNTAEIDYIKEVCIRENLFFKNTQQSFSFDKDNVGTENSELNLNNVYT